MQLADPYFSEPAPVDLILGADVLEELLLSSKIKLGTGLALTETKLGWVVMGAVQAKHSISIQSLHTLDSQLQNFWRLEEVPDIGNHTEEEMECENFFDQTTYRDKTGRFVVKLPFKQSIGILGNSFQSALCRFYALERKLNMNPDLKQRNSAFINEFLSLRHMEVIPDKEIAISNSDSYYLPHHCVFKEDSSTTKLRVVFDASAKTSSGVSLNKLLLIGPKLQSDLFHIVLRLRLHAVAFSADIAKMYRQVALDKPDRDYHRLLWREETNELVQHLRMTRVTHGVASSSHHSIKCLMVLAKTASPEVRRIIERDMYVDDLLSGADSIERALAIQTELIELLQSAGFQLRKWTSNNLDLIKALPPDYRESKDELVFAAESYQIKALGISWQPVPDTFHFKIDINKTSEAKTKRQVLSEITRLFDHLGWLSPIVVKFKCFVKKMWKRQLTWDEKLPDTLLVQWEHLQKDLRMLTTCRIPRRLVTKNELGHSLELHVFCDASENAYAAAVYSRVLVDNVFQTALLASKSRVAPLKPLTVPRLELCGALLGAELITSVQCAFADMPYEVSIFAWTDSTVLSWISNTWKTFVRNRVAKIQTLVPSDRWGHVKGENNPADLPSRGVTADVLLDSSLWWKGPEWLRDGSCNLNAHTGPQCLPKAQKIEEHRTPVLSLPLAATVQNSSVIEIINHSRFRSFKQLVRVFVYVTRFTKMLSQNVKIIAPLKAIEIQTATEHLIKCHQELYLSRLKDYLNGNKAVPKKFKFENLTPFIDEKGLIRVGGRLRNSDCPTLMKHPYLIPKASPIAEMIIFDTHVESLHGGYQLVLSITRQHFWITSAKSLIKKLLKNCINCCRFSQKQSHQLMGDLPEERVNQSMVFENVGVDVAGPFICKVSNEPFKTYAFIFVCMSTKACHIEHMLSMTEASCLAALKRFFARRGKSSKIFSDNAPSFLAARETLSIQEETDLSFHRTVSSTSFQTSVNNLGTEWLVIPTRAPHFGGLWESAIKSMKHHLRREMRTLVMSCENFQTLLTQIESMLNSRPLTPISNDPNDFTALTPGHFLIGRPMNIRPILTKNFKPKPATFKDFQEMERRSKRIWKEWYRSYLTTLQKRNKWTNDCDETFKVGDLVLVAEDNVQALHWLLGRVQKTFKGNDGRARVVEVRTQNWVANRPIVKLRHLPFTRPTF